MQINNKSYSYIYVLTVLSCLSVLLLHINSCYWKGPNTTWWIDANIVESLFYFAVPCFFMISGVTLIDYKDRYDTKTYFKKKSG